MRKSKWQIFGSLFSSCVILIMLAFSVKLFMQNGAGSTLKVFAKGSSGAMITASVEGYDENLSNINKKEFSTKLNGKRVRNWDIGDMAFGADENGNPKPIYINIYLKNLCEHKIAFEFRNNSQNLDNMAFDYSIENGEFASNFDNEQTVIENEAVKLFTIRMSVIDASISFSQSPIDFTIQVEDYYLD